MSLNQEKRGESLLKSTIRKKIVFINIISVILSTLILGFLTYTKSKNTVINSLKNSCLISLENVNTSFFQSYLYSLEYAVKYWSSYDELINYKNAPNQPKTTRDIPDNFKSIGYKWTGYTSSNPNCEWIFFGSEADGSFFCIPNDSSMPKSYDSRKTPWYKKSISNPGKIVWSPLYKDAGASGDFLVSVSKSVMNKDKLVGVVGIDVKLRNLSDIINKVKFKESGYIILVDKMGIIYSHPDKSLISSKLSDDKLYSEISKNDSGSFIHYFDGSNKIISYLTIKQTDWKLVGVVSINPYEVVTPIKNSTIIISILSSILVFIIGFKAFTFVTKPLDQTMEVINEVGKGNFSAKLNINSNDEFKVLGDSINSMVEKINTLILERDGTLKQLTLKNNEIEEQNLEISIYAQNAELARDEAYEAYHNLNTNYLSTVKSLAKSIEAKDKYTGGHCERVNKIANAIGVALSLTTKELIILEYAAILHDIGKIGIPSNIINKEGKLTDEEFNLIKQHPTIGYNILKDVNFLSKSREIIIQHHERLDGKGYPEGLDNLKINKLAKILSVADSYDAMTSARPYRKEPLTKEQAIEQLLKYKGTQFDEEIIDIFIPIIRNNIIE